MANLKKIFLDFTIQKSCNVYAGEVSSRVGYKEKWNNFNEIALWHRRSPVNLLPIFRSSFFKNSSGRLLPNFVSWSNYILCRLYSWSQEHHSCVVKTDEETIIHPLGQTTIPLYQILTDTQNKQRHSKEQIDWNDNHQAILDKLLHTLWHFEVLHYPNYDQLFILRTDASRLELDCSLFQMPNGKISVLGFLEVTHW